jgi:hypothetical protein
MVDPSIIGPSLQAATTAFSAFNTFLPDLSKIREGNSELDHSLVANVRMGEVAAAGVVLGIGAITSALTGDPTPTLIAAVAVVALIFLYEATLRAERPFEKAVA